MLKRHEIEVLLKAGHAKIEVARLAGVSLSSVKRIAEEDPVVHVDDTAERGQRRIGRPSIVENFRKPVVEILQEKADLPSVEVLRRVRGAGYAGGKSALYARVASLRPQEVKPLVRFEGLPGEFSQHDFGQVDVEFMDGTARRIRFLASRLKYSRWMRVSVVKDETVESLVRSLAQHLDRWGGARLVCVFDRPKTVALKWRRNGEVTEWNPVFACATLEMGIGVGLCGNVEIARPGFGRDFQARWEGWKSPGLPSPPLVAVGGAFPRFPQRVISTATSPNPFSRRSTAGHREIRRRFLRALMLVENLLPVR
jgi:transposase